MITEVSGVALATSLCLLCGTGAAMAQTHKQGPEARAICATVGATVMPGRCK